MTRCLSGPLPGVGERCRERDLFLPPLKGHRLAYTVAPAPERQGVGPRLRETGVTSPVPGSKKIAAFGRAFPAHKTASDILFLIMCSDRAHEASPSKSILQTCVTEGFSVRERSCVDLGPL